MRADGAWRFLARVVTPFGGLRGMFTAALILNGLKTIKLCKGNGVLAAFSPASGS